MFRVRVVPRGKLAKESRVALEGVDLTLPEGATVRDMLSEVGMFDQEIRRVTVNGKRGRMDQVLRRNDVIELYA
jgi:hypothetical protein